MAAPTAKILARIVSVMESAHDVELERKQSNGDILVTVRMRVQKHVWQAERPDVVSDDGWHGHERNARQRKRETDAAAMMQAAKEGVDVIKTARDKAKVAEWAPKRRNVAIANSDHSKRWDLHDAMRDEGIMAERQVKKRVIRTRCKTCRARLDDEGTCAACLDKALRVDADELFRV